MSRNWKKPIALVSTWRFLALALGLIVSGAIIGCCFLLAEASGVLFVANWAEGHVDQSVDHVVDSDSCSASEIPAAYWYAHFPAESGVQAIATDMSGDMLTTARDIGKSDTHGSANDVRYVSVELDDGSRCVLGYNLTSQFSSRSLRDSLPNPENILIFVEIVNAIGVFFVSAKRSRKLAVLKMRPLIEAAQAVERRDLSFPTARSDIREIDDVLVAMDRMRSAVESAFRSQWEVEQRQRQQIADLAHDLKTPLTIIRGNAELLSEIVGAGEEKECSDDIQLASVRISDLIEVLIAATRGSQRELVFEPVGIQDFASTIEQESARLVHAHGDVFCCEQEPAFLDRCEQENFVASWDRESVQSAIANLVSNACEYSPAGTRVCLTFGYRSGEVCFIADDEGIGFSADALEHGTERFFRDDDSRSQASSGIRGHWGLGLTSADDSARAHGGRLELSNRTDEEEKVLGARVSLILPMAAQD